MTRVTLPETLKVIDDNTFSRCYLLASVDIPNSVISIGNSAFSNSGLTSIVIPNSVSFIGDEAFYGCSDLTDVTLPSSLTNIENSTFSQCRKLASISIPNTVENIGDYAFSNCDELTSVDIPNSVDSIGKYAFNGCYRLASVHIPHSVTSIGEYAFTNCAYLAKVNLQSPVIISNGNLKDLFGTQVTEYIIDADITELKENFFYRYDMLKKVQLPEQLTSISESMFEECNNLRNVVIPATVTEIGDYAFYNCTSLDTLVCNNPTPPACGEETFYGVTAENCKLFVPAGSVEIYSKTSPWSDFAIQVEEISSEKVLVDEEPYINYEEVALEKLTYKKTLPNTSWNPLYVPFRIAYEDLADKYEVAYINAIRSYDMDENGAIDSMVMEVVKIKDGIMKENYPYLIKAKAENDLEFIIEKENQTIYPAISSTLDCSTFYTKFEITGTYKEKASENLNGALVIGEDGAWQPLGTYDTVKPYSFYMTISQREDSPVQIEERALSRIVISVLGEDAETGIQDILNTGNENVIYDLNGRRILTPQKDGVYILNGKKVVY